MSANLIAKEIAMKTLFACWELAHNGPFGLWGGLRPAHNGPFGLCAFALGFGLPVVFAGLMAVRPAAAQYSMRTGALGGSLASRATSRPLGGFAPSAGRSARSTSRAPLYGYPYAYSVWVPDYFDYLDYQNQYAPPYAYNAPYGPPPDASSYYGPPPALAPTQQPVIINQYFGAPGPPQANAPEASFRQGNALGNDSNAQAPGDPIGSLQNYYLIAYKNHAVYTALAYWVEDKTLHYVTTQNTHNQASLDLIDLTLTKSLNQHNDVPFSIAGN
jgi:hypothetical protein